MPKTLVIVESPAKAKTLSRFLGRNYRVEASFGHIRDLPESAEDIPAEIRDKSWASLAVDTDGDFKPYYVVPASKKRHVAALRSALRDVSELLLATDPDREGESISLHLKEVLKPKVPVRRVTFHEITREAVQEAVANAHELDDNLIKAQESRRILDRLYGYTLSPVLWKKVRSGLSAGRVQSVAVRLIVEREEARRAFRGSVYWDIEARLSAEGREFAAVLARVGNERVASGRDFDSATGRLSARGVRHLNEQDALELARALEAGLPWQVTAVDERPGIERPAPPFTTSTLTQEASRKLGFSTSRTMRIAQRLKDGVELADGTIEGIITYHRTDSTTISEKALHESGRAIREMFGDAYYTGPRRYQTRVRNAQEAHEAIRPTDFTVTPQSLVGILDPDELKLYDLVWKRTMASQMPDARVLKTTVEFTATDPSGETCVLTATGKAIEFAGYRRAYVEGSDDPDSELEARETILPPFKPGDLVVSSDQQAQGGRALASLARIEPKKHETTPPARYTEASLIKKLEEEGIGRPSTYEPTIETILRRGYVFRQGKALVPSFTAFAVTELLRDHFADFVDIGFTAEMETDLDEISNGERPWLDFIREFFRGDGRHHKGLEAMARDEEQHIDYPVVDIGVDPESGRDIRVRIGKFGPFLQLGDGGAGNTASLPDDLPPADLTVEKAVALIRAKAVGPRDLGVDPATGQRVYLASGRFGPYVQLGDTPEKPAKGVKAAKPKRASLPAGCAEADVDLQLALRLLSLPRVLGTHPGDGQEVVASAGRFGPYVKHGDEFRSLDAADDVYAVSLDRALALLAAPKQARRRQAAARTVLRELGVREDTAAAVVLFDGRYGPYVSDGKTNASLPKTTDAASIGLHEAIALLDARAAAGPRKEGRAARPGCREPQAYASLPGFLAHDPHSGRRPGRRGGRVAGGLRGRPVVIHEMRPVRSTEVHRTDRLAELVCSNSLRSDKLDNAVGLLKEEMRRLGSLVMRVADGVRVPAGAALAVDRERFAETITREVSSHPLITVVREEVTEVPEPAVAGGPVIVATGPLTSPALSDSVAALVGHRQLFFYDAVSPIVLAETIDTSRVFRASRWGRSSGGEREGDYLNCPFTQAEYETFYQALVTAKRASVHDLEKGKFFEGCLPVEVMAHRGVDTLRFGPMKPVGLTDPRTGRRAHAVVQLRQDNLAADHFSLVGFQTQLTFGEQARVFRLIPGLERAEFARFGLVHRNTYINGPRGDRDVAGAIAAGALLRRTDLGRGGLRGVGSLRAARGNQRRRGGGRRFSVGPAADDSHRRLVVLCVARRRGALPAEQHHVRDYLAARADRQPPAPGPQGAQRGDLGEGDQRAGEMDRSSGQLPAMKDLIRAFLAYLRLNRNASVHTVRPTTGPVAVHDLPGRPAPAAARRTAAGRHHAADDPRVHGRAVQERGVEVERRPEAGGCPHLPPVSEAGRADRCGSRPARRHAEAGREDPPPSGGRRDDAVDRDAGHERAARPARSRDSRVALRVRASAERTGGPRPRRPEPRKPDGSRDGQGAQTAPRAVQPERDLRAARLAGGPGGAQATIDGGTATRGRETGGEDRATSGYGAAAARRAAPRRRSGRPGRQPRGEGREPRAGLSQLPRHPAVVPARAPPGAPLCRGLQRAVRHQPARHPPLVRHAPARSRRRSAGDPGAAGSRAAGHHAALHARQRGAADRRLPSRAPEGEGH